MIFLLIIIAIMRYRRQIKAVQSFTDIQDTSNSSSKMTRILNTIFYLNLPSYDNIAKLIQKISIRFVSAIGSWFYYDCIRIINLKSLFSILANCILCPFFHCYSKLRWYCDISTVFVWYACVYRKKIFFFCFVWSTNQ